MYRALPEKKCPELSIAERLVGERPCADHATSSIEAKLPAGEYIERIGREKQTASAVSCVYSTSLRVPVVNVVRDRSMHGQGG